MKRSTVALLLFASASALAAPPVSEDRAKGSGAALPTTLGELDQQRAALQRTEQDAARALRQSREARSALEVRLIARGRAFARLSRLGLLPIGDGLDALAAHAARLERLRRGIARDLTEQRRLDQERQRLAAVIEEARARRATLEVHQQTLDQARTALLAAQDRALAFQRAFSQDRTDHTAVYGAGVGPADPNLAASGMSGLKGRLPFPVAGRTEVRAARRDASDGPGLELRAPLGTPVQAIFGGRVAFADQYADYGLTVILEHGERHYTVNANLKDVAVRVGDEISAGTRIGTIGDRGDGPHLYFEIRVGTATVDPAEWFGL